MSPTELFDCLVGQGFTLTVEGPDIRVAPASRLSAEQRRAIREQKADLLDLLRKRELGDVPDLTPEAQADFLRYIRWFETEGLRWDRGR